RGGVARPGAGGRGAAPRRGSGRGRGRRRPRGTGSRGTRSRGTRSGGPRRGREARRRGGGGGPGRPGPGLITHGPQRRCIGCGGLAPKRELVRLIVSGDRVVPDPGARAPGRGAYIHATAACAALGLRPKPLRRAFRASVAVPDETVNLFD